jgi:glucan biosynthesis protein C
MVVPDCSRAIAKGLRARRCQPSSGNVCPVQGMKDMMPTSGAAATSHPEWTRRYEVDWLRVLGMMAVFLFHNARFFDTEGWHVKSDRTSFAVTMVIVFMVQWMMPLFFILSGIGIYHALSHQRWPQYLVARVKRLAVPLLFGIFVIIAPWQVYLERISHGQYSGPFWRWYPQYFHGWFGLGGNFAWMGVHLWYLEFLFVFSVITLPLFLYLRTAAAVRLLHGISQRLSRGGAIFLLAPALGAMEFIASIPAIQNSVFGQEGFGGWSCLPYLMLLILGYILAAGPELTDAMERHRRTGLVTGIIGFVLGYAVFRATEPWSWLPREFVLSFLRGLLCIAWLVTIYGYGTRYLRFSNAFLRYANEAVLPFYILHQAIILTVGFYVLRLDTSLWIEYAITAGGSFVTIMILYELLIRRTNLLRFLFGMKMSPRSLLAGPEQLR